VDDRCAGDDQADPVASALRLDRHIAFGDTALLHEPRAHRRLDDPIPNRQLPDPAGLEEARVAGGLRVDPSSY
jgi:hypothetical protein